MSRVKITLISLVLVLAFTGNVAAKCKTGDGMDFLTMVNWPSIFPISIGGITIIPSTDKVKTIDSTKSPICTCPMPPPVFVRIGIPIAFWEPARYIETVKDPWCFPSLGLDLGKTSGGMMRGGTNATNDDMAHYTTAQGHFFIFPIWALLETFVDTICVESSGFDVAYLTELDPLWQDDSLAAWINPEAILFANPVAQIACVADSVVSNVGGMSLSPLFWCMGSWGSAYPLTGHIANNEILEANAGIASRLLYKLARQLLVCDTNVSICGCIPTPIWVKHNYKMHIAAPIRDYQARPIGQSGLMWSSMKDPPFVSGGNFVWMLYRRRSCCAF